MVPRELPSDNRFKRSQVLLWREIVSRNGRDLNRTNICIQVDIRPWPTSYSAIKLENEILRARL